MSDLIREIRAIEDHMLDAIERCEGFSPATVVFASVAVLARLARDYAPSEQSAKDLLNLAIDSEMRDKG